MAHEYLRSRELEIVIVIIIIVVNIKYLVQITRVIVSEIGAFSNAMCCLCHIQCEWRIIVNVPFNFLKDIVLLNYLTLPKNDFWRRLNCTYNRYLCYN